MPVKLPTTRGRKTRGWVILEQWCQARKSLGDCKFECNGCGWCENVRRAARG